eukprot:gene923-biopygen9183
MEASTMVGDGSVCHGRYGLEGCSGSEEPTRFRRLPTDCDVPTTSDGLTASTAPTIPTVPTAPTISDGPDGSDGSDGGVVLRVGREGAIGAGASFTGQPADDDHCRRHWARSDETRATRFPLSDAERRDVVHLATQKATWSDAKGWTQFT